MGSAPNFKLRAPSHTNPGPVQSCLTDHSIARTYAHLGVQEGVQNDNKATSSAVFTLLYALISLFCSLFPMSGQDFSGRNSDIHAAAQRFYE